MNNNHLSNKIRKPRIQRKLLNAHARRSLKAAGFSKRDANALVTQCHRMGHQKFYALMEKVSWRTTLSNFRKTYNVV